MSYIVLARKCRPQNFGEVVGQQFITTTLKNSLSSGNIAHAILFSGPRGVGKTSTARILAKSINCEQGPTPTPCSKCTNCIEISEGKSVDVIEIDAASHTGVADVREIIENVKYLPASGKTKVYIIDEAHMLSNSAFNALLKTLEEPPEHALFILATTEVHKIPLTILSRCQKYDFRKVSTADIKESLKDITTKEGIQIDDDTLHMIASESDGSLRDALSLLDQLNTTFEGNIKYSEASALFGVFESSLVLSLFRNILSHDVKQTLQTITELNDKGINPKKTIESLLRIVRYSVFLKACGQDITCDLTDDEKSSITKETEDSNISTLEYIFNQTLKACEDIGKSSYPEIALEMNIVKLANLDTVIPIEEILDKLENLSPETVRSQTASKPRPPSREKQSSQESGTYSEKPDSRTLVKTSMHTKTEGELDVNTLIEYIKMHDSMTGIYMERADKIEITGDNIKIMYNTKSVFSSSIGKEENLQSIKDLLKEKYSKDFNIKVLVDNNKEKQPEETEKEQPSHEGGNIMNNKALRDALDTFGGRIVKVKNNQKGEKL